MKEVNKIEISGRLVDAPKYKTGESNGRTYHIAHFDLCHHQPIGKNKKINYYFKCVAFKENAIALKDWQKGAPILINGYLKYNAYMTKTGSRAYNIQIIVEKFDTNDWVPADEVIEEHSAPATSYEAALKDVGLDEFDEPPF